MKPRKVDWIYRAAALALSLAAIILHDLRFKIWQIVVILAPVTVVLMMTLVYLAPGRKSKPSVERLKRHLQ